MSNVLPAEAKKTLDRRARSRAIFVTGLAGLVAAAVAALALAPTFISIAAARASLDAPSADEVTGARDDQAKARRAQALVDALESVLATTTPSQSLATALELRPAGITVTAATYQSAQRAIVLTGEAARRESVSAYRDALEKSGSFAGVDIPVAALAGTQDGRFTVTLSMP